MPASPHLSTLLRDGIVNGLGADEHKHRASNQRRSQMRWQVMVDEELTAHQEERGIVYTPDKEEESSRVPHTVANI